uniref:Uncharacterized protein n=1 Tax=Trypanosoma congolense (strain IL3000) TaxID=1068625 RepID=G0UNI1_TRYCI|nr:conserved hypothetical protein [Trypanosoma congolense IL3000]
MRRPGSHDNGSLLKALDEPESFNDWLHGVRYSKGYMTTLKKQANQRAITPIRDDRLRATQIITRKRKCNGGGRNVRAKSPGSIVGMARRSADEEHPMEDSGPSKVSTASWGRRSSDATKRKGSATKCCGTPKMKGEVSHSECMRYTLLQSYSRLNESYVAPFPAMLTPYKRPYWAYIERSVVDDGGFYNRKQRTSPEGDHSDTTQPTRANSCYLIRAVDGSSYLMIRGQNPCGQSLFVPTPLPTVLRGAR